ncbi:MAG: GcrA cell cycle regulator [Octadecabacter sp.]|nr:GcrA cell cycle regulator [Octadecabacter sp.]
MSWTDERVDVLKKMWGEGQSASQIAKELGGVTRNAVIGKVHRLGLSNRAGSGGAAKTAAPKADAKAKAPSKPKAAPKAAPKVEEEPEVQEPRTESASPPPQPKGLGRRAIIPAGQPLPPQPSANEISPEALAKVNEVEKTAKKISLMELTEKTCKWPVGDPATDQFWFCGLPVQQGKPYCEAHVGVAFQPMSSRRDRRR